MFRTTLALTIGSSVLAIIYGLILIRIVFKKPSGNKKMADIAKMISNGAKTYLNRQYGAISVVAVVLFVILLYLIDWRTAVGFLTGAIFSGLAGYIGSNISLISNVRVAEASRHGIKAGFSLAFKAGSSIGLLTAALALISVAGFYAIFQDVNALIGLALGGSLISIFARLGGGIYTKGADIGTTADIFETYVISLIALILLSSIVFAGFANAIYYPLILGATALLSSFIGLFFAWLPKSKNIMVGFYRCLIITTTLAAIGFYFVTKWLMHDNGIYNLNYLYYSALIGLVSTILIFIITQYYTSSKFGPVKSIIKSAVQGSGINIITGLAVSMRATALPIIVISSTILGAYSLAGIFGIAIATMSMLSLAGTMVAIDSFGPIVDNAEDIAKMAELPPDVKAHTNSLDTAGNITKTVIKGYTIASAGVASVILFSIYIIKLMSEGKSFSFDLSNPHIIVGLLVGGLLPYYFSSLSIESLTQIALRGMILPLIFVVATPILVGFVLGPVTLAGLLIGAIITGLFLSISMTTGGSAADNAKKTAATGDLVGNPYKDVTGPAINPMVKVVNIIAILIIPFIAIEISLRSKEIVAAVVVVAIAIYIIVVNRKAKKN